MIGFHKKICLKIRSIAVKPEFLLLNKGFLYKFLTTICSENSNVKFSSVLFKMDYKVLPFFEIGRHSGISEFRIFEFGRILSRFGDC